MLLNTAGKEKKEMQGYKKDVIFLLTVKYVQKISSV